LCSLLIMLSFNQEDKGKDRSRLQQWKKQNHKK